MTESSFRQMVEAHRIGYAFLPDLAEVVRERSKLLAIREAARALPITTVCKIWNAAVDHQIDDPRKRLGFYWPVVPANPPSLSEALIVDNERAES